MKVEEYSDFEVLMARYVVMRISRYICINLIILTITLASLVHIGVVGTISVIYAILVIAKFGEPSWDGLTDILNYPKENKGGIENWSDRRILYELFAELRGLELSEKLQKELAST